MKKLFVSLLLIAALLLPACAKSSDSPVSSLPEGEKSDINDTSDFVRYPENGESVFDRDIQIALPQGITYSLDVRKDYSDVFAEYFDLNTENNVGCYVWTESGELKFGLKPLADIDFPEDIKKSLPAASLGEMRAVLSRRFPLERRRKLCAVPIDDSLSGYIDELEYMLGIGENCIEYTISLGRYTFDIPVYGKEATELYDLLNETRESAEALSFGSGSQYKGDEASVGISFAPAGTEDFGGISDYGNYSVSPNGYMSYIKAMYSSSFHYYMTDEAFYRQLCDRVIGILQENGIKYPFAEEDEIWCSVLTGLHSDKRIITGDKVLEILALAESLSEQAKQPDADFVPGEDFETAIYIVFYNGNMDIESEFVVYSDEYSGLLTPLSYTERPFGILPKGSYQAVLELVAGKAASETALFECKLSFGLFAYGEESVIRGNTAKEIFDILASALKNSREANQKEILNHSGTHDPSVFPSTMFTEDVIHITFNSLPEGYPESEGMVLPWFNIWPDEYAMWSPSSLLSRMPDSVILPEGTYKKVYELVKSHAEDIGGNTVPAYAKEGVDGLLTLLDEKGISYSEQSDFYNVTPESVKNETDCRIFKDMYEFKSYVVTDGEVYELCLSFGGSGFHNAVPCDFDNDGNKDLLVASSWGSGIHRSVISVFNTVTKNSEVLFSGMDETLSQDFYMADMFVLTETDAEGTARYYVEATRYGPSVYEGVIIGEVISQDGKPVFVLNEEYKNIQ